MRYVRRKDIPLETPEPIRELSGIEKMEQAERVEDIRKGEAARLKERQAALSEIATIRAKIGSDLLRLQQLEAIVNPYQGLQNVAQTNPYMAAKGACLVMGGWPL